MALYSYWMEYEEMSRTNAIQIVIDNWGLILLATLLGVSVNFASFWVTQTSSALALKIAAVARNIGIVLSTPFLLGEMLPFSEFAWYMFSTGGDYNNTMLAFIVSGFISHLHTLPSIASSCEPDLILTLTLSAPA